MNTLNTKILTRMLKIDAKAVGIPLGAAEAFIAETLKSVTKATKYKESITDKELKRIIVKELQKYDADLAYVFKNRDKII
ncbi:hypothetical protein IJG89_01850 [Candidatus Saccharibacteria bacterium]|nr:hypothetical protein [Candidatus Saccharibacteria bacterium]